jgi:serine/threonine protein phosphatase PrpC
VLGDPNPTIPHVAAVRVKHRIAFKTDIGRSHRVNQDAGGAWTYTRPDGTPATLLIVADGVSAGRRSQDVSRLVSQRLLDGLGPLLADTAWTIESLVLELAKQVKQLNHEVANRPHAAPSSADATTLVAAVCIGDRGGGIWIGDSRVYRLDGTTAIQLTRDHSWAENAVSGGFMTAEQAAADQRAHMITRWLGPPDREDPGAETFNFDLGPGSVIVCCSDGLYGYFSLPVSDSDEMAGLVQAHMPDLQAAADHLVDRAIERGGHDDITIAALQIVVAES